MKKWLIGISFVMLLSVPAVYFGKNFMPAAIWFLFLDHTHTYLTPSKQDQDRDQQEYAKMKVLYQETLDRAVAEKNVEACRALPESFFPLFLDKEGKQTYHLATSDGPWIPDRYEYWPRSQCVYGYAARTDISNCASSTILIAEQQENCRQKLLEHHEMNYLTLDGSTP